MFLNNIRIGCAMRIVVVITAVVLLLAGAVGAVPLEEWNRTYGDTGEDYLSDLQQKRTADI